MRHLLTQRVNYIFYISNVGIILLKESLVNFSDHKTPNVYAKFMAEQLKKDNIKPVMIHIVDFLKATESGSNQSVLDFIQAEYGIADHNTEKVYDFSHIEKRIKRDDKEKKEDSDAEEDKDITK